MYTYVLTKLFIEVIRLLGNIHTFELLLLFQPKHPQSLLKNPKPITHTIVVTPAANAANAAAASSITSTGTTTTTVVNPKLFSRLSPVLPSALPVTIKTEPPSTTVRQP